MLRKLATRACPTIALAAAGLALALTLGPTAQAYTITQLPNMGFGVLMAYLPQNGCHAYKVGWRNDPKTDLGSDCDPGFQNRLNAFMAQNCPPRVCPENAPTTVTTTQTETDMLVTTAAPPDPVTTTVTATVAATPTADNDPAPAADIDPAPYVAPSPPTASFDHAEHGLAASFADTSGAASVTWSFGDGANGSGPNSAHLYGQPGSYVVVETVVDKHGLSGQTAATVTVTATSQAARTARLMPLG